MNLPSRTRGVPVRQEDGVALVITMMVMLLLLGLTGAVIPLATTDVAVLANHRRALQMFYAAEALMEWVVHDLERARSWDDVLQGRETSGFRHGSTRVVQSDGTVRDLNDMTSTLRRTRGPAGGHPERGWQLFAFGPFDALAPVGGALGGLTLAAWVADDRGESDRDLLDDTNDTLVVYAAAFGMAAAQRAIRATVRRRPDGSVDVWDYRIVR